MLGDDEHPISFLFESRIEGGHVKVTVRAGMRGMRAVAGELTFRPEEWTAFRQCLAASRDVEPELVAMLKYAPEGATSHLEGARLVYLDTDPIEVGA